MKTFTRVRSAKDYTISILILLSGLALFFVPSAISISILGVLLVVLGIVLFICMKTAYKDSENGKIYSKKEIFFAQSYKDTVVKALSNANLSNIDLKLEDKGNGLRLDIYYDRKDKAYIQVHEYIPYKYEPASAFFEYNTDEVKNLIK